MIEKEVANRIGYIDAMRGLAMLLVVVGHVYFFSFDDKTNILYRLLIIGYQIPLFFFVSGALFRVPEQRLLPFVGKKAFLLLVPAALFMVIYAWVTSRNMVDASLESYKIGYWFTFSLFEFVILYTILTVSLRVLKINKTTQYTALVAVALLVMYAAVWCEVHEYDYSFIRLFGLVHFRSFPYFVIGAVMADAGVLLGRGKVASRKLGGVILPICLVMHLYTYRDGYLATLGSGTLWFAVLTLTGLMVLLMGFRQYEGWSESGIGRVLQTIGRYTLDVYFIHYFFLPRNLGVVGEWFRANPNPVIEYVLAMAVAAVVIAASLLVGRIIRLSPTLAHWLLAAKK